MMHIRPFISLAILFVLPTIGQAATWTFTGSATAQEEDRVYQERHELTGECRDGLFLPLEHQVEYVKEGSKDVFARKTLEYEESVLRPSLDFRQPAFGERMQVTNANDETAKIHWQTNEGGTETYEVALTDEVVVDSGFDNLVRTNWQRLTSGGSVDFRFLAPTRGEHYAFVLEPAEDSRIDADVVLRIEPSGFVMGFLVEPILLGYSDDGTLTDYLGLTNVRKDRDNNYTAHIRYSHDEMPGCGLIR
ncbi:hypothetical protein [Marinobacter salicampi]|uniref:hypothetical protein n=1 Tax=Marinobacter salicampi TaxID=435907 RepID=UPI001F5E8DC3|nr:hypothetical protein [Marinobacter salicampi]